MQANLDKLLAHNAIWRCGDTDNAPRPTISTGYAALDAVLPNGGWPRQTLIEVLSGRAGIGELRLLMPALSALLAERDGYLVWVGSPYQPYAPALLQWQIDAERVLLVNANRPSDVLWATERSIVVRQCCGGAGLGRYARYHREPAFVTGSGAGQQPRYPVSAADSPAAVFGGQSASGAGGGQRRHQCRSFQSQRGAALPGPRIRAGHDSLAIADRESLKRAAVLYLRAKGRG